MTGSSTVASLDPDLLIGEMVFVPNPSARAEDDGILMGYGWHRGRDEGQLLLLDAQTLESIATVHLHSVCRWASTATGRRPPDGASGAIQ